MNHAVNRYHPDATSLTCQCGLDHEWGDRVYIVCRCGVIAWKYATVQEWDRVAGGYIQSAHGGRADLPVDFPITQVDKKLWGQVWDLMREKKWEQDVDGGDYETLANAIIRIAEEYAERRVAEALGEKGNHG